MTRREAFEDLESTLVLFEQAWRGELTPEEDSALIDLLALVSDRLRIEDEKDAAFALEHCSAGEP